jgi:hypothetical protein
MRHAIIENGVVANIVVAEPDFAASKGWIVATPGVQTGWLYDGENFAPPDAPGPEPLAPLQPWQFWAALRIAGYETDVKAYVAGLDQPQQAVAASMLEFSLEYRRDHPLVEAIRVELGMTPAELDGLWSSALALSL